MIDYAEKPDTKLAYGRHRVHNHHNNDAGFPTMFFFTVSQCKEFRKYHVQVKLDGVDGIKNTMCLVIS